MRKLIVLALLSTLGLSACIAVPVESGPRYRPAYVVESGPHCWWRDGERYCR